MYHICYKKRNASFTRRIEETVAEAIMKFRGWSKCLYVILLIFFLEGYAFLSEPSGEEAIQILLGKLFGTVTELNGDDVEIKKFIFISEKMGYLILFHILYGTYLSDNFRSISVYIFSRAINRRKWFWKKVLELSLLSMLYNFLLVGILAIIALHQSGNPVNWDFWRLVLVLYCIQSMITILTTLFLNLCAIKWNILASFLITYSIICFLIILAIRSGMEENIIVWNPFCYVELGNQMGRVTYLTLLSDLCLSLIIGTVGAEWITHMDISLQDKEK